MHNSSNIASREQSAYSIVLVNYKTLELTSRCLQYLQNALQLSNVDVWVVDNDSNDESLEYLRTLSWIRLIERKPSEAETGTLAHGRALDLALERINTDYLFLLHTDTFIYNPMIFDVMLEKCLANEKVIAVGCKEQIYRGTVRSAWRFTSRFFKHYYRRIKLTLGLPSKDPKPYSEVYLKSFCALWNAKLIKQLGLSFSMKDRTPGYELQDRAIAYGYQISFIAPRKMFSFLDHIQAGTITAIGGYKKGHRRVKAYLGILKKVG